MKILLPLIIALTVYVTARGSIRLNTRVTTSAPVRHAQVLPETHQLPPFL